MAGANCIVIRAPKPTNDTLNVVMFPAFQNPADHLAALLIRYKAAEELNANLVIVDYGDEQIVPGYLADAVLSACEEEGIADLPFVPYGASLGGPGALEAGQYMLNISIVATILHCALYDYRQSKSVPPKYARAIYRFLSWRWTAYLPLNHILRAVCYRQYKQAQDPDTFDDGVTLQDVQAWHHAMAATPWKATRWQILYLLQERLGKSLPGMTFYLKSPQSELDPVVNILAALDQFRVLIPGMKVQTSDAFSPGQHVGIGERPFSVIDALGKLLDKVRAELARQNAWKTE